MLNPRLLRRAGVAVFLTLVLVALAACQELLSPTSEVGEYDQELGPEPLSLSGPVAGAPGKFLYTSGDAFWTFEPSTLAKERRVSFPPEVFVGGPVASPDGTLVAYSQYTPAKSNKDPGGTDLYVMAADGSSQRLVLGHDAQGVALSGPAWADGASTPSLFFTRFSPDEKERIERVQLDGTGRTVIVEGAHGPTVSSDGKRLAYLTSDPQTSFQSLWIADTDGKNARRIFGGTEFESLSTPRFSPDGSRLVFAAVGGASLPVPGRGSAAPSGPFAWLAPKVAHAHGVPWDLWLVNADGTGLRRLTDIGEDSPYPAWSPDGKWIAFAGELGLYLVDDEGKEVKRLAEEYASGGLTWLPR